MKWHAMLSDLSATFTAREGCYPQVRDDLCWRESNASKRGRRPNGAKTHAKEAVFP
jgi:hypothetical protein